MPAEMGAQRGPRDWPSLTGSLAALIAVGTVASTHGSVHVADSAAGNTGVLLMLAAGVPVLADTGRPFAQRRHRLWFIDAGIASVMLVAAVLIWLQLSTPLCGPAFLVPAALLAYGAWGYRDPPQWERF